LDVIKYIIMNEFVYYKVGEKSARVPVEKQKEFEEKFSDAKILYNYKGRTAEVPISKRDEFVSKYGADNLSYAEWDESETKGTQENKAKPSWGESAAKGAGAGLTRYGKGIFDTLSQLSSGMLYNDPETGAAKRIEDYDTQMKDETNTFRNASIMAGETANRLSREADPTGGEKGFVDLISDGKIGMALQKGLAVGAESLPQTLSAYNPYTMALSFISNAG
jgi:hypothetical protein